MPTGKEDFKAKPRTVNRLRFRNLSLFELFTVSIKLLLHQDNICTSHSIEILC